MCAPPACRSRAATHHGVAETRACSCVRPQVNNWFDNADVALKKKAAPKITKKVQAKGPPPPDGFEWGKTY